MTDSPRRIQLRRTKGWKMPENTVKVTRPSKWGNPWPVSLGRDLCIALYRQAMHKNWSPDLIDHLSDAEAEAVYREHWPFIRRFNCGFDAPARVARQELRGKNLACWCPIEDDEGKHVPCHADVLLHLANSKET